MRRRFPEPDKKKLLEASRRHINYCVEDKKKQEKLLQKQEQMKAAARKIIGNPQVHPKLKNLKLVPNNRK